MKKIIILAAAALLLCSCATSRFFNKTKAADFNDIALVQPYSNVNIKTVKARVYSDSLSRVNRKIVTSAVQSLAIPIKTTVQASDPEWMLRLYDIAPNHANWLQVPDVIRNAVTESGCRYGLLVTDVGYIMDRDAVIAEEVVDAGLTLLNYALTGKNYYYNTVVSCKNSIYAIIYDNQTGEVVWYGSIKSDEARNPLNRQTVNKQVTTLFRPFYK